MHPLDFPLWLRALHFCNLLFVTLLIRSGLEILSAHPKLYWNDNCVPGTAWLNLGGGVPSNRCLEPTPQFGHAAMAVGAASTRRTVLGTLYRKKVLASPRISNTVIVELRRMICPETTLADNTQPSVGYLLGDLL